MPPLSGVFDIHKDVLVIPMGNSKIVDRSAFAIFDLKTRRIKILKQKYPLYCFFASRTRIYTSCVKARYDTFDILVMDFSWNLVDKNQDQKVDEKMAQQSITTSSEPQLLTVSKFYDNIKAAAEEFEPKLNNEGNSGQ